MDKEESTFPIVNLRKNHRCISLRNQLRGEEMIAEHTLSRVLSSFNEAQALINLPGSTTDGVYSLISLTMPLSPYIFAKAQVNPPADNMIRERRVMNRVI